MLRVDILDGEIISDFSLCFSVFSEIFAMSMYDFNNQNFQQNLKSFQKAQALLD